MTRFRLASGIARSLPRPLLPTAARVGGAIAARVAAEPTARLEAHLGRVLPGLSAGERGIAARSGAESYVRYWIETLRIGRLDDLAVERGFRSDGYDPHILDGLDRGRGVILALPHLGGWEWAGRWLVQRGHTLTAVVERLEPPEVYEWFVELREAFGLKVVPNGPDTGRHVLAALKRNEIVALLCDRDLARSGVEVEFFGGRTLLPAGPVLLALRSGAPILPTAVYFTDQPDGHVAIVGSPLDIHRSKRRLGDDIAIGTQRLAQRLEELIARAPEQWHLFQPNWLDDPGYHGSGAR